MVSWEKGKRILSAKDIDDLVSYIIGRLYHATVDICKAMVPSTPLPTMSYLTSTTFMVSYEQLLICLLVAYGKQRK